jgi:hypothetical protein
MVKSSAPTRPDQKGQTNAFPVSRAKAGDVFHFLIGEPLHVPQHKNNPMPRRQFLNHVAQPFRLVAMDG